MDSRVQRIAWVVSTVVVLISASVWAWRVGTHLSMEEQRRLVPSVTVWGMHASMVAIIAGFGGFAPAMLKILGRRRCLTALGLIAGGYAACGLAPQINRIFFDEHIYMQIGQTIAHTGRAEGANYARAEYGRLEMYASWTNKQPNGLPYLLSWLYRAFGVSEGVSHSLNRVLVGVASAAIYLGLALVPWRLPKGASLAAALLFIFTPMVLWWGHTVAVEPGAAATAALAFLAACVHARLRDAPSAQGLTSSALFLSGAIGLAVYFRPESLLVFPVAAAVLWSTDDRFIEDLAAWGALALAVALAIPNLLHLWSVRGEDWGATDGRRFDLDFLSKNVESNAGYFVDSRWFPVAGTLLAITGALWLLKRNRTAGLALGLWFALSWGIFVLFYAGGYHYGVSSRYGVVSCAPIAIFMGIGLSAVFARLRSKRAVVAGLGAAGVMNWVSAMDFVPTRSREAVEAQADAAFVAKGARALPEGSLIISPDPCMWLLQGKNSSQFFTIDHMIRHEMRELAHQFPGGVYVHWSFWHNAEPLMAAETAELLALTEGTVFMREQCQEHTIALFRIDTPASFARFGGKIPEDPHANRDLDKVLARARERLRPADSGDGPTP